MIIKLSNDKTCNTRDTDMGKLTNKVAIVTGASKGIGANIAKSLAADGASVVVNYASSKEGADRVVAAITAKGGKAIAVQGDVSVQADITRLFTETKKAFGRLDVLVNNAGVYEFAPLGEVTEASFHKMFNLNVLGVILTSQEALKYFGAEGGSIINIGSNASTLALPTTVAYTATKGALDTVTRVLAAELGPKKIRVNSINPGMTETEGTQSFLGSDFEKSLVSRTPLGRIAQPGDIGPVASFLASDEAGWVTGELVSAGGGLR
jgi:3-oxoacyl-[acyl-carrier protein] reductase